MYDMKLYDKHFSSMDGKSGYKFSELGATRISYFQNSFCRVTLSYKNSLISQVFCPFLDLFLFFDAEQKIFHHFFMELLKKKNRKNTAS